MLKLVRETRSPYGKGCTRAWELGGTLSSTPMQDAQSQEVFRKVKPICVPILEHSLLKPASIGNVSRLLSQLHETLLSIQSSGFTLPPSLVSYIFLPLSTILRRNASSAIPDQVLEKLLNILGFLCDSWWWDCDLTIWDQVFKLCGAIIGGIEGKGKGRDRAEETKEAAARCLWSLLRERTPNETPPGYDADICQIRLSEIQRYSQSTEFTPVLGQTLDSILTTAASAHLSLQRLSLDLLFVLISSYMPSSFVPSVLPGVVSSMTKASLGGARSKGWANGEIVSKALLVMQKIIVRSVGNEICLAEGAIQKIVDLEDFANMIQTPDVNIGLQQTAATPYSTARTSVWLRATSSQLHIALNSLTSLVSHPTPSALLALADFSKVVLLGTSLTLPQSQTLLLSFLLSLSNSIFSDVSRLALDCLFSLLSPDAAVEPTARQNFLQRLMQMSKDTLSALPRLILSQADARVEHAAGQLEGICRLAISSSNATKKAGLSSISDGIGVLLGPAGGIEKWGWTLLSVLELSTPSISVEKGSAAQLLLEGNAETLQGVNFPELTMKNIHSRSGHEALTRMLRAMGRTSGENCLYAIEWFIATGRTGTSSQSVAAFWCACRLFEGIAGFSLDDSECINSSTLGGSKRLERFSRAIARDIAALWDESFDPDDAPINFPAHHVDEDSNLRTEIIKGITPIRATLQVAEPKKSQNSSSPAQPLLHRILSLHLLAITSGVLQGRFTPLLISVFYPILHSIVSPVAILSTTALATLSFITSSTSYASPANLLLSNFDYALDAVSRRLTRRWLDVDATQVLAVLVRLVGSDIVAKAGDVVEECFDRLDEFHGYQIIVEGLVEVLGEVIKVIEVDETFAHVKSPNSAEASRFNEDKSIQSLLEWVAHRNDPLPGEDNTDYGPAPQRPWGETAHQADDGRREAEDADMTGQPDPTAEPTPTATQALTKQIVTRSIYFLTHNSPVIRARILTLLSSSVPVLPESTLLPSIHQAWPFILNRFADPEPFVVSAAAGLVESLATYLGDFMSRRVWDDVWPRFRTILTKLDQADSQSALARRGHGSVGTESAYTQSHRLHRSILRTMIAAVNSVQAQDNSAWEVILAFRRFLHNQAHEELQRYAGDLYIAMARNNEDAVWLALMATSGMIEDEMLFLRETKWDIKQNVRIILRELI